MAGRARSSGAAGVFMRRLEITAKLMIVNMPKRWKTSADRQFESSALPGRAHPLDAAELEITHIALRQGTVRRLEMTGQRTAANPVAAFVLLEDRGLKRVHAVQLENDTAVQQRSNFHEEEFTS